MDRKAESLQVNAFFAVPGQIPAWAATAMWKQRISQALSTASWNMYSTL